jgi:hypothetical protein
MTLSPRVGGATSKPTDVSPSPAGQRYASNSCITTKMTYEFFNELIENFLQAQTGYSVTNVPNDPQALKKLLDALRTGGFNFTVGTVGASGTVTTPTVSLTGGYEITSPQNINVVIDNNNNETDRGFFIFAHSNSAESALFFVNEQGQSGVFSNGLSGFNIIDLASNNTLARPFMTFNRNATKGGSVTRMGLIGIPLNTNEEFHIRSDTTGSFVIYSNANVDIHLDDDNNGANAFNIFNGADVNVFNVQEDGTVNIAGDVGIAGGVTAQNKPVRAFTRAVCAVDAGGTIIAQKGIASVTKTGTGVYRVVISESATSPYFTQATAGEAGANTTNINATTTDVRTYNTSPSPMDAPFTFEVFY